MSKYGIDEGHCLRGADTGARDIFVEELKTREIGKIVISDLETLNNAVINCTVDSANSLNDSLQQRVDKANNANVDGYVSIHLNASPGGRGVEIYIHARGGKAEDNANKVLAELVKLGYVNRGVKVAKEALGYNLFVLARTKAPAILIECGFVDSQEDCNRYNANNIAKAIVRGLTGQEVKPVVAKVENSTYGIVTASILNVRAGRGSQFPVIGQLKRDTRVKLCYLLNNWYSIDFGANVGYVSADYIKKI